MSEKEIINFLREEFATLRKSVNDLDVTMGKVEERIRVVNEHGKVLKRHDIRLTEISGESGKNGRLGAMYEQVKENTHKVQRLMLSKAMLIGYGLATGGAAAAIAKFLS